MAAVPPSRTPEQSPAAVASGDVPVAGRRVPHARRLVIGTAVVVAVVLLFLAYLQVSRTYPENSDESNDLLMAWDILHGNLLLHGWYLSDVSFITTELPQYAILVGLLGLHTGTAHVAAAMTYTLVVVFAVLLARGSAAEVPRDQAWPRMLLTAGLLFAPQLGVAVFVVLLSLGHIGTFVPLLAIWLVIDRAGWFRPRGIVPVLVGLLMTWALVADPLVLVVGIIPLVAVCVLRVVRELILAQRRPGREPRWAGACLRAQWYELGLGVAAIVAEPLAAAAGRGVSAHGGFILHPVPYQLAPVRTWPKHAYVTAKGLLALFGAKPEGPPVALVFALLHLAGIALVLWAGWRVARHFVAWPDMISQILLVAMVVNVVLYVPSTLADATDLNAREFALVLPFGAVLAGRTLAAGLLARPAPSRGEQPRFGWRRWVAVAVAAGYAASLGWAAARPAVPPMNARLATFLADHHLTSGIGGYWLSSVVTVGSDGAVTIRAVVPGNLSPDLWEAKRSWYDPTSHQATFLVTDSAAGFFNHWQPRVPALAALGSPARTYHVGTYTIYVWDKNLLSQIPGS
jgi:hypothetical protein